MSKRKGLLMIFTGDGKGKTTSAIGQAFRAAGHGYRVLMINFMKGRDYGEIMASKFLPNFEIIISGRDVFVNKNNPENIDLTMAAKGISIAEEAVTGEKYDMVILDEINVAVDYNLVPLEKVLKLIESKLPEVDIILTGRNAPIEFINLADIVSEIREVKHHYNSNIAARKGIEY